MQGRGGSRVSKGKKGRKGREGAMGRKEKREGRGGAEASRNGILAVPILVCFRRLYAVHGPTIM